MLWLTTVLMMYPNVRRTTGGCRLHPPPHPWCYSIFPRNWFTNTGYLDPLDGKCLSIRPRPIVQRHTTMLLKHHKNLFCVGYSPIITNFIHVSWWIPACHPSISVECFITDHNVLYRESMWAQHRARRCGRMAAYHMVQLRAHGQASPTLLLAPWLLDTLLSTSWTSASVRTTLSLRFCAVFNVIQIQIYWYHHTLSHATHTQSCCTS